jgi:hypothetical protein
VHGPPPRPLDVPALRSWKNLCTRTNRESERNQSSWLIEELPLLENINTWHFGIVCPLLSVVLPSSTLCPRLSGLQLSAGCSPIPKNSRSQGSVNEFQCMMDTTTFRAVWIQNKLPVQERHGACCCSMLHRQLQKCSFRRLFAGFRNQQPMRLPRPNAMGLPGPITALRLPRPAALPVPMSPCQAFSIGTERGSLISLIAFF